MQPAFERDAVRAVCVSEDEGTTNRIASALSDAVDRLDVRPASADDVAPALREVDPDCVAAVHDPPDVDGLSVLRTVREVDPDLPVVLYSPDPDVAAEVFRAGATDFVPSEDGDVPFDVLADRLVKSVDRARTAVGYRELFEGIDAGVVVHDPETGAILKANEQFRDLLDVAPGDDVTLDALDGETASTDADAVRDRVRQAAKEGSLTFEWHGETPGGEHRWLEISLDPVAVDGIERVVGIVHDVADRVMDGENHQGMERQFAALIDHPESFVAILDGGGRVLRMNDPALSAIDATQEAVAGSHFADAPWADGAVPDVREAIDRAMRGESVRSEAALAPPGRDRIHLDLTYEPVTDDAGEVVTILVAGRDVTTREERERRLDELLEVAREFVSAEGRADVADLVVEAVETVLGYDHAAVWCHDPESDALVPTAVADATRERAGALPDYEPGSGVVGTTYDDGEPRVYGDLDRERDHGGVRSALLYPLSDRAVVEIGTTTADAFDDSDLSIAGLLATLSTAALDRADRRETLLAYEQVLENVRDSVFLLDGEGRFEFVTDALADRLGYAVDDLLGEPFGSIVAASGDVEDPIETVDGRTDAVETAVVTGDGEEVPVEVDVSPLPADAPIDGAAGTLTDISELAATRARFSAERTRFTHLFDNLPDPAAEIELRDERGIVRAVNEAFEGTFGVDGDDIRGDPIERYIYPSSTDPPSPLAENVLAGETAVRELERETDAGVRTFLVRAIPFDRDGDRHAFVVYTDVTDQKERERYLQVLNRVLRHNLRNELNVITMTAARITSQADDGEVASLADDLRDDAAELSELTETAKKIERAIGGRSDQVGTVDAVACAERVVEGYAGADATVETDLPDRLPVRGDERLDGVLDELIENAIEHNDAAAGTADDGTPWVRIAATVADDGRAELRVADDGPGIPEVEQETVTGDRDLTQLEHGSGLGLWLVRWVVESFGGDVSFETTDRGSAVIVRLPRPEGNRSVGDDAGGPSPDDDADRSSPGDGSDRSPPVG